MGATATASFSDARRNLTQIADRVVDEGVEYTIFKRSKPLFKIVPIRPANEGAVVPRGAFTRQDAARRTEGRGLDGASSDAGASPWARMPEGHGVDSAGRTVPDGGDELFAYMEQLRERMPQGTPLASMTPAELKRELASRDV